MWTIERRRAAADRARRSRPWRFATGPTSELGKFIVSLNLPGNEDAKPVRARAQDLLRLERETQLFVASVTRLMSRDAGAK